MAQPWSEESAKRVTRYAALEFFPSHEVCYWLPDATRAETYTDHSLDVLTMQHESVVNKKVAVDQLEDLAVLQGLRAVLAMDKLPRPSNKITGFSKATT